MHTPPHLHTHTHTGTHGQGGTQRKSFLASRQFFFPIFFVTAHHIPSHVNQQHWRTLTSFFFFFFSLSLSVAFFPPSCASSFSNGIKARANLALWSLGESTESLDWKPNTPTTLIAVFYSWNVVTSFSSCSCCCYSFPLFFFRLVFLSREWASFTSETRQS